MAALHVSAILPQVSPRHPHFENGAGNIISGENVMLAAAWDRDVENLLLSSNVPGWNYVTPHPHLGALATAHINTLKALARGGGLNAGRVPIVGHTAFKGIFKAEAADLARAVGDADRAAGGGINRKAAYKDVAIKLIVRHMMQGNIDRDDIPELHDWVTNQFR